MKATDAIGTSPGPAGPMTTNQRRLVLRAVHRAGLRPYQLFNAFNVQTISQLSALRINEVLKWIEDNNTHPQE